MWISTTHLRPFSTFPPCKESTRKLAANQGQIYNFIPSQRSKGYFNEMQEYFVASLQPGFAISRKVPLMVVNTCKRCLSFMLTIIPEYLKAAGIENNPDPTQNLAIIIEL